MNGETKQLQEAADKGDVDAQYRLAECYAAGTDVTPDAAKATAWYARAAQQGHVQAAMAHEWRTLNETGMIPFEVTATAAR